MSRRSRRQIRRAAEALDEAIASADWPLVQQLGGALHGDSAVPTEFRALAGLAMGQAHFMLGDHLTALETIEADIDDAPVTVDLTPYRYWAGMSALIQGEMNRARRHFQVATQAHTGLGGPPPGPQSWAVGAAARGLAQVEAETGDLDAARALLEPMLLDPDVPIMAWALLGRVHQRAGADDEARRNLLQAMTTATRLPERIDVSQLATVIAILISCAETYVELGHPDAAVSALELAEQASALADGISDPPDLGVAPILHAEIARLTGDPTTATSILDEWEQTDAESPEITAQRVRARARVSWIRGDLTEGKRFYAEAAALFDDIEHEWQAQACRREATTGPRAASVHPEI